jgi:hypothetical protein
LADKGSRKKRGTLRTALIKIMLEESDVILTTYIRSMNLTSSYPDSPSHDKNHSTSFLTSSDTFGPKGFSVWICLCMMIPIVQPFNEPIHPDFPRFSGHTEEFLFKK